MQSKVHSIHLIVYYNLYNSLCTTNPILIIAKNVIIV